MDYSPIKSNDKIEVELCCEGAGVVWEFEEKGVAWPDGVRRWNRGKTLGFTCSRCGRALDWRIKE